MSVPRITFGTIVLNGEPFVRHHLKALYPFAHQIVVVEGAAPAAKDIADAKGHSTDGTLETLQALKKEADPEGKLVIVTAEDEGHPDGFWPGEKDEQSQAFARRATGNYLWQVDIDEFYQPHDMAAVLGMLVDDPGISAVSFKQITFWGGFDYIADGWLLRRGAGVYHRLFKWGPGFRYTSHRPPTVVDTDARDVRTLHWIHGEQLAKRGIILYHYSLVFPRQVAEKCNYYSHVEWDERSAAQVWANEVFGQLRHPFRVHNVYRYPSWLGRFRGTHPPEIEALRLSLQRQERIIEVRATNDIEHLLRSFSYRLGRALLALAEPLDRRSRRAWQWTLAGVARFRGLAWRTGHRIKSHVIRNRP